VAELVYRFEHELPLGGQPQPFGAEHRGEGRIGHTASVPARSV